MIRTDIEILIRRPAPEVFAFVADLENNPAWQSGMLRAEWLEPGPPRVGMRYQQLAKFLGRDIISTFEVVAYKPGQMISAKTIDSTFPITFSRSVRPEGPYHTYVRAIVEGNPEGVFRLASPIMGWMVRRTIRKDYQRLKKLLEEGAAKKAFIKEAE